MSKTLHSRVVQRACDVLGGVEPLAERLGVSLGAVRMLVDDASSDGEPIGRSTRRARPNGAGKAKVSVTQSFPMPSVFLEAICL